MELTSIEQDRKHITLASGERKYRILTIVTERGELPYPQIFLFEIQDINDVTLDVFTRIATISDLEEYEPDRTDAISAGDTYYLDAEFTVDFDQLEAAVQAKDQIYSRVDGLTKDWFTYATNFYGVDDTTSHPSVSPEFEQQLKDDYVDAKEARETAETDLATAEAAVTSAEEAVDLQQTIVGIYEAETEFCSKWADTWPNPGVSPYESVPPGPATLTDPAYDINKTLLNDFCATATTMYASARAEKQRKDAELNTAMQTKITADATLATAQAAEAAALAAVLAVCPDFDPDSV